MIYLGYGKYDFDKDEIKYAQRRDNRDIEKKLSIILFNNYTSTEVTIDDAYNYVMGN